jgi:hypothetical protein
MEREVIIRRSTSPWASPMFMVPKKYGSWRPSGDFRRLNLGTEADVYPLPNMLDFGGCTKSSIFPVLGVALAASTTSSF